MTSTVQEAPLRLQLLGPPRLTRDGQEVPLPATYVLALAHVALEGGVHRVQLAARVWPASPPATAGANLRQLVRRLRVACGADVLERDDERVRLSPRVQVDVLEARRAAQAGRFAEVLAAEGELLSGHGEGLGQELEEWLEAARQEVASLHARARAAELTRLEGEGELQSALALAEVWARREPASEEAGRAVMRLHYLLGSRTAALVASERLRRSLERELHTAPSAETLALARSIERGVRLPGPPSRVAPRVLPPTVLRPPVLAGREAAWRALEEGWEAGQLLVIVGAPGEGKTRLATDFAEAHGRWRNTGSRVGDREVPYSSAARTLRTWLPDRPDLTLPEWVRRELLRILPELGAPGELPAPMASEADKLRFYQAVAEAYAALGEGVAAVVADDAHYIDPATNDFMEFLFSLQYPLGQPGSGPRVLCIYRRGEAPGAMGGLVRRLAEAGHARVVDLAPLGVEEVRALLAGLGLTGVEGHAERITRYTGGNPLFVVETVKHLVETGALEAGWPERLPPPGRVGPLIQQRLTHLSAPALRLARVAALAGTSFSLALATEVLEEGALAVGEWAVELEAAQVLTGERFSHDLVHEAVAAGIPEALRAALHLRLAQVQQELRAPPIVVARHWMGARQPERGLPFLLEAASVDEQALLPQGAAELYAHAAALLTAAGRGEEAARARAAEVRCRQRAGVAQAG